jgi:hypothetical protein
MDSQNFDSLIPVYDAVPENWDEGRQFLVEALRRISNAINNREISWFVEEEIISGKQFIPLTNTIASGNPRVYRTVFRKVVNVGPLVAGANAGKDHGVVFDFNFTLVSLWVSGTNSTTFTARTISGNDVLMNATQLVITSPQAFDRAFAIIEYTLEI